MRLTQHKREWVINKVKYYCEVLGIVEPKVFLTMSEYNTWKAQKRLESGFRRVGRSNCLGVCHKVDGFIVILPKRSRNLKCLDNTIRHELIHYSKPSYNHYGANFLDRMKRLKKGQIKNGRFC